MALSINGEIVPQGRIEYEANAMRGQYYQAMQSQETEMSQEELEAQLQEWAKENVIEEALMRQEALKRFAAAPEERVAATLEEIKAQFGDEETFAKFQSERPEDYAEMLESVQTRIKIDMLREELTARAAEPKASEVADFYVKNKEQFSTPELVHAMHIVKHTGARGGLVQSEGQALNALVEIKREVDAGRSFEEVADAHSDCSGNGGDLGWFPRGQMVESFEEVVFNLEPGQVSGVFKTEFGYHLAKVVERRPASVRPLGEVREDIAEHLLEQKKARIIESFLDQQRAKAAIETVEEPAPVEG